MTSERNVATAEDASEINGEATYPQGHANSPESSMSASIDPDSQITHQDVNLHAQDIFLEQRVARDDPMHALPQGDARPNAKKYANSPNDLPLPKLTDPWTTEIPMPDGDPFEHFLKPMLKKDGIQCDAWKEEVQNILIFAGLFSAVVTAFIIESYQQLRPDPNDSIIGLLALIAERLDNPFINGTMSVSSILVSDRDTNFAPSRSNININIFWFISLVLSLTAALIGIVTLQWLREHQRYNSNLKPRQTMAMLHMRLDSFKRWYVPQIFAGLPLLLQGALALFFAGLVEFLFGLRLEVAVPVTLSVCVPLIFLIATTVLPILQVFILQDPFRLSINNDIPLPCPYKSPQSLIFRRICIRSKIVFTFSTTIVAAVYVCLIWSVCFIRTLADHTLPIFHIQKANLKARLRDPYPQKISKICDAPGDWTLIDSSWLYIRTVYAVSLQLAFRDDCDLVVPRMESSHWQLLTLYPDVYDCTRYLDGIRDQPRIADRNALYGCMKVLYSQEMDRFKNYSYEWGNEDFALHCADLYSSFSCLLFCGQAMEKPPITAAFFKDVILHGNHQNKKTTVETLRATFMAFWAQTSVGSAMHSRAVEVVGRLVMSRLEISPERLFSMTSGETWLPRLRYFVSVSRENASRAVTNRLLAFLDHCSAINPDGQTVLRPAPAPENYGAVSAYMHIIVFIQLWNATGDTMAHLTRLCDLTITPNLIQEKPFLMIAACFYLNEVVKKGLRGRADPSFPPLLELILKACRITNDKCVKYYGWKGLNDAIDAIYRHHKSPQITQSSAPPTDKPYSTTSLTSS